MADKEASPEWQHGCILALTFGMGLRFTSAEVEAGSSFSDGTDKFIAVYPERYQGSGGGMLKAHMNDMPVFEFALEDGDQAEEIVAAFNFFAIEGRTA